MEFSAAVKKIMKTELRISGASLRNVFKERDAAKSQSANFCKLAFNVKANLSNKQDVLTFFGSVSSRHSYEASPRYSLETKPSSLQSSFALQLDLQS